MGGRWHKGKKGGRNSAININVQHPPNRPSPERRAGLGSVTVFLNFEIQDIHEHMNPTIRAIGLHAGFFNVGVNIAPKAWPLAKTGGRGLAAGHPTEKTTNY